MQHISKLPHVGPSIFTTISKMAQEYKAINLAQGFPGFSPDPKLIELVSQAFHKNHHQYSPMSGILPLREILCAKTKSLYEYNYNPKTEITITAGATQAIFTAISAFIKKDEEVIVFKPAYDCYEPAIELHGAKPVNIEMKAPAYKINWQEVKDKITTKTKMILINTPHNPTGTMLSKKDMKALTEVVEGTDILILSDEVYEHITFDERQHQSVALYPKLAKRAIIVYSFGKTFHVTGWKLGYALAPTWMMKEFQKVHQFNVFSVNHPFQYGLYEYLKDPKHYLKLPEFYQKKRDFFLDAIKDSKFDFTPAEGTYFQTLSYRNISDENDSDFTVRLIKEKKLACIPVSAFQKDNRDEKMLRFCFAKENNTLEKAAEILNSF